MDFKYNILNLSMICVTDNNCNSINLALISSEIYCILDHLVIYLYEDQFANNTVVGRSCSTTHSPQDVVKIISHNEFLT